MFFNLSKYKEQLNKSVLNGKISPSTAEHYAYAISVLNDHLADNASSKDVAKAINDYCSTYIDGAKAAVSLYERKVDGQWGCRLTGADRARLQAIDKTKEIYYRPKFYRERIRKSKYRLAFTIQERAGLRISEVAKLTPADIMIQGDEILINVRCGKGGKQRFVNCLYSKYLLEELPKFEKMPTYSALRAEASHVLGISTHDLRKVNARTRYWKARAEGKTKTQAVKEVQHQLGHEKSKITKDYLGREYAKKKNDWNF